MNNEGYPMTKQAYLKAVNNRCDIADNSACVDCKAVYESSQYIRELQAELEQLKNGNREPKQKEKS